MIKLKDLEDFKQQAKSKAKKQYSFRLQEEPTEELLKIAKKLGVSQTDVMSLAIERLLIEVKELG